MRAYLDLMRMRMPDRLQYDVSIDAGLESIAFPPMALLTLVENAVRHGIDPSEEGGRIDVRRATRWCARASHRQRLRRRHGSGGRARNRARQPARAAVSLYGATAALELAEHPPRGLRAEIVFDAAAA